MSKAHNMLSLHASEIRALEVDAYSSVHDMIHAAIIGHGPRATLREIYWACEARGRIAYKRSGGSRLITHNEHWKSQIRHALYTCPRFIRAGLGEDFWTIAEDYINTVPITCKVIIRGDDDPRGPLTPGLTTVRSPTSRSPSSSRRPPRATGAAARVAVARGVATRNQQARAARSAACKPPVNPEPVPVTTKGRRSRSTRPAARFTGQNASISEAIAGTNDTADISNTLSATCHSVQGSPDSLMASYGAHYTMCLPSDMVEGEDETSHTGTLVASAAPPLPPPPPQRRGGYMLRERAPSAQSPQPSATAVLCAPPAEGSAAAAPKLHRPVAIQAAQQPFGHLKRLSEMFLPSQCCMQPDNLTFMSTIGDRAAGSFRRTGSAEAESPPSTQSYTAHLRSAATPSSLQLRPHSAHCTSTARPSGLGSVGALNRSGALPGSQRASMPHRTSSIDVIEATVLPATRAVPPSVDAASEGPIKKRFKAAAKAQAAAQAAAQEATQEANSAVATTTEEGSLTATAACRLADIDRCSTLDNHAVNTDLLSTVRASPFKQDATVRISVPECHSPCSASDTLQQRLDSAQTATVSERRRGMRTRTAGGGSDRWRAQLWHTPSLTAEQLKIYAHPVSVSTTDDATTGTATATVAPLASLSQACTSSVAQKGWHGVEDLGGATQGVGAGMAAESVELRRSLRSQTPTVKN